MKYILLSNMLLSLNTFACIVGPIQHNVSESNGFSVTEKESEFDKSMNEIQITAPLEYEGKRFDFGVYSISMDGKIIGKSIHSKIGESGKPEFIGYISNLPGFSYSISFLYGEGRCKSFEFIAVSNDKRS